MPPHSATHGRDSQVEKARARRRAWAASPSRPGVLQLVLSLGAGGTERLVLEICKRVQSRFRITVCTLDEPGDWAGELRDREIEVVPLMRRPGFRPSLAYRIAGLAERSDSTILHCHHYSPFVYGRLAKVWSPGLRVVFTEHGRLSDGPPSPKRRLVNPLLARIPGPMFAVSGALRESMIAEGFPGARVEVVHNGIDPGAPATATDREFVREMLGVTNVPLVIGTVARLDPVKDLGTLIESFAQFCETHTEPAVLVIIGDGEERGRLEAHAVQRGLGDRVRFLGQRNDARYLLPAFDLYVNSSTSEGVSLTILEAMAAQLPVVATRVGGTPEVLAHGESGLLVPARTPPALADAFRVLAVDPERRRTMGAAGRQAVIERFTIDRMVEHYAQVYLRLAR